MFISDVLNKPIEDITESEWDFWDKEFSNQETLVEITDELDYEIDNLILDLVRRDWNDRLKKLRGKNDVN